MTGERKRTPGEQKVSEQMQAWFTSLVMILLTTLVFLVAGTAVGLWLKLFWWGWVAK